MSRYAKKPFGGSKVFIILYQYIPQQDANRRVQTEAADFEDIDLQSAIQKFKNLQDKTKTPSKYIRAKSKSPTPFSNKTVDYSQFSYTNLKIIGQGSFGVVHKAKVIETGEIVAIKKVLQDKRYKNRELQIMQEIDHPNCIALKHAYYTNGDTPDENYLHVIMDYYPESLYSLQQQYAKNKLNLPEIQIKLYSYQLLRACAYVHSKNICHRDLKPHNILVNPSSNHLRLCDFGSAKRLTQGEPNIAYICARCYRAPELFFGATNYTAQIDIWSVGCIIAEMLNGSPIFQGDSAVDQLVEIIKVLGTPQKEDVLAMNENYDMKLLKIVQIRKQDWKRVLNPISDPDCIDLVSKLLVYSPLQRLSALQALAHHYFDELRDENYYRSLQIRDIPCPDLFDFSKDELNKDQYYINKLIPKWYRKAK